MNLHSLFLLFTLACFTTQAQNIDYRSIQSPVKNQGNRGTCTAFAVAASLEILPNAIPDISEQYLYAATKAHNYTKTDVYTGEWLKFYKETLPVYGILAEEEMPYNLDLSPWDKDDHKLRQVIMEANIGPVTLMTQYTPKATKNIYATAITVHALDSLKKPEYVRNLLLKGYKAIPVGYQLYGPQWQKLQDNDTLAIDIFRCGYAVEINSSLYSLSKAKEMLGLDFYSAVSTRNIVKAGRSSYDYSGHAVTIVGATDDHFIIKNSWGTDWGNNGYALVSFDFHRLFANEMITIGTLP